MSPSFIDASDEGAITMKGGVRVYEAKKTGRECLLLLRKKNISLYLWTMPRLMWSCSTEEEEQERMGRTKEVCIQIHICQRLMSQAWWH